MRFSKHSGIQRMTAYRAGARMKNAITTSTNGFAMTANSTIRQSIRRI